MIKEEELIIFLIKEFPKFKPYWESFLDNWSMDEGITIKIYPFSDYALDIIKSENESEIERVCEFIEYLTINGDEGVQAAMTTVVLEYLLSKDPEEIQFKKFAHHLGKESVEYCKAWNEFCGCKTEGIDY